MKKVMFNVNEVITLINEGKKLLIAADEKLLRQLPKGEWIGGSIPYFMGEEGGETSRDKLFVNEVPAFTSKIEIKEYTDENINQIYKDGPLDGFTVLIIPASSPTHLSFALHAPNYEGFATIPLIGWISGVMLDDLGKETPKVILGNSLKISDSSAVAMHITLTKDRYAELMIVNIFEQSDGDVISFLNDGFSLTDAYVNGKRVNFAEYVIQNKIDTRLPLVADYFGVLINISFQNIDKIAKKVDLYAPVFKGIQYKLASPVKDYVKSFTNQIKDIETDSIVFSCNCILNYLYCNLEGKKTANVTGPITFGEIAYQLLNQTMTYMKIGKY
jgi:hypothetical protein